MSDLDLLRRLAPPVAAAPPETVARARGRLHDRPAPRRRLRVAAPLAVAVLAAAIVVTQLDQGHDRAWAAGAVRLAQASPRLLLGDGWNVTRVDEWAAGTGEMTFGNGDRTVELRWLPASENASLLDDREHSSESRRLATVLGERATVYRYAGSDDYTAIWVEGDAALEARGLASSADDFVTLLHGFRQVGVDDWLTALPASAVTPQDRGAAVDGMLAGLPLPASLDRKALEAGAETRDRYQLGAQVAGAVACGWIAQWVDAKASGDDASARQAERALATSHRWPVLQEMNAAGDYPEVLWTYADAIRSGADVPAGKPGVTAAGSYRDALGCS